LSLLSTVPFFHNGVNPYDIIGIDDSAGVALPLVTMGQPAEAGDQPRANCAGRHDLPWACPVIVDCAVHGLTQPGGFYAGVWLPWRTTGKENDDTRMIRAAGRRALRRVNESKPRS
jgi:hypothetical protein